jgi:hypothetical protein
MEANYLIQQQQKIIRMIKALKTLKRWQRTSAYTEAEIIK